MSASVVTFYSYKGGVGRTQALANVAVRLANQGKRVILVDMDLESPGLHAFFSPLGDLTRTFQEQDFADKAGVLDYLTHCSTLPEEEPSIDGMLTPCQHRYLRGDLGGSIQLLPPGRLDGSYVQRLAAFSWERFYLEQHGYAYLELLRRQLCSRADVVLVDSRTGLTDAGMVCTFQLPDLVVVLFALHSQGIEGAGRVARAVAQRRREAPAAGRAGRVLLVPSRVDDQTEFERARQFLTVARRHLATIEECELLDGQQDRIPYLPFFAFGENVVDPWDDNRLSGAYARLSDRIGGALLPASIEPPRLQEVESPVFVALEREGLSVLEAASELVRSVRASWDPDQPMDRLATQASDALYHQAELGSRLGQLNQLVQRLFQALHSEVPESATWRFPRTVTETETFEANLPEALRRIRAAFLARTRERLLAAAFGDTRLVDEMRSEVQERLEAATFANLETRVASLEAAANQRSIGAQLTRGILEYDFFASRFPLVSERALWVDERIQSLMDQGDPTPESALQLENLLRLRVLDRHQVRLLPTHWASYDVLCMLLGADEGRSQAAFRDIGLALWADAWSAFFSGSSSSPFAGVGVDCHKQLEMVAQIEDLAEPLVATIADGIIRAWLDGGTGRDRVSRLFAERRADPCLRSALARLAVDRDDLTEVHALWLLELAPFDGPPFRKPLRVVLEHLATHGRVGEAYYGFLAVAAQEHAILDDRAFFFVHAAFLRYLSDLPERAGLVQQLLYDTGFSDRLGASPHGVALLAILGCGLEHHERDPDIRAAARSALRQSLNIDIPPALQRIVEHPSFEDPLYAWIAPNVANMLAQLQSIGEKQIHSSWHLHTYYEAELKKLFAADIQAIRELPVRDAEDLRLSLSADEWIARTAVEVGRDHQGDPPVGGARDKIRALFEQANELLRDLAVSLHRLSDRHRAVGEVVDDAALVTAAGRAIRELLEGAPQHAWLKDRILSLWELAP